MKDKNTKAIRLLILSVSLFLGFFMLWVLWTTGFFQAAGTPETMHNYIQQFAPLSHLVFFFLQLASVIIAPIPSNLTTAAGGFLFGPVPAFLLSAGAVTLGSIIVFQLSRLLGQAYVEQFISKKNLTKYGEIIRRKQDTFLFLSFLLPFFPDDLICILAGLTQISFRRFLILVVLARPWGLLAASAIGGSVLQIPLYGMVLLGSIGVFFFLFAMKYGDRFEEKVIERLKQA